LCAKILVTGGAGFIGSHVVDRLVTEGFEVRVLDNLTSGTLGNLNGHLDSGAVDFIHGDIRNAGDVKKSLEDVWAVIHMAALVSVPVSVKNPELTYNVNLVGTLNLLRASAKMRVKKFVFISTCAVCGDPEFLPVTELTRPNPISPYAESKLLGERYCMGFGERGILPSTVLRFFNVYGPRQGMNDYSGVITIFADRSLKGLSLTVYGDGSQTRDFVNVSDVAWFVFSALQSTSSIGEIFNVGSGKATTINELAKTVVELSGRGSAISYTESRVGDIKDSYADISKGQRLLGYRPKVSLRIGLGSLLKDRFSSL
jgi:nucleoside-diphosphate-sugar epimerase